MERTKRKRTSKKTKLSWRKNVDITDVENYLEKERLDERIGNLSKKASKELFFTDTQPQILPKKAKRLLLKSKQPKCFEALINRSAVPDPISKRNRVRSKIERQSSIRLEVAERRNAMGIIKRKDITASKDRSRYEESLKEKAKKHRGDVEEDVWSSQIEKTINPEVMDDQTVRHTLIHMGIKKRKPQQRPGTSVLPSIETPHPGTSYNPSYEDHQNLLREVAEQEQKLLKEEQHLERVTTKMFARLSGDAKTNQYLEEMSEGLDIGTANSKTNESSNSNADDTGPSETDNNGSTTKAKSNVKKTKSQRRKQREEKLLRLALSSKKVEKKKTSDIYKLKQIGKQIAKSERRQALLREKKEKKKILEKTDTKQLSKKKFEKPDADFVMAEELTGNLRNIGAVGNPLKDRFLRLQQRNVLPPSAMRTVVRGKVKRYIKPDHKIDESKFVANKKGKAKH